jgi:hypothetical protein
MALAQRSSQLYSSKRDGLALRAFPDEDSKQVLHPEEELKLRYQGILERIEPDQAFHVQVTFWQYGQDSPAPLRPRILQNKLQRYLDNAFWRSERFRHMELPSCWQVSVAQPREANGPRSYVVGSQFDRLKRTSK